MNSYQGEAGGPRDPATPGGYCLTRCLCGQCPQYAKQMERLAQLRDQELQVRVRLEAERAARRHKHRGAAA